MTHEEAATMLARTLARLLEIDDEMIPCQVAPDSVGRIPMLRKLKEVRDALKLLGYIKAARIVNGWVSEERDRRSQRREQP